VEIAQDRAVRVEGAQDVAAVALGGDELRQRLHEAVVVAEGGLLERHAVAVLLERGDRPDAHGGPAHRRPTPGRPASPAGATAARGASPPSSQRSKAIPSRAAAQATWSA